MASDLINVTSQEELDRAITNGDIPVCRRGFFTVRTGTVRAEGSSRVVARGSSRVVAWGSSSVVARGSSRVEAWGSSRVEARGSSRVVARGSSRVVAWGSSRVEAWGSSRVEARGSSRVEAWGSSSVEAWGSSSVVARGSSRVEARGSSRVEARGSSSVEAWESSSVEARGSSSVEASTYVAIQRHTSRNGAPPSVRGGVLIDIPSLNNSEGWLNYFGVKVTDGHAILFKGVDADHRSAHGADYTPGATVTCDDWNPKPVCGGGLHLAPHPDLTHRYCDPDHYVACRVAVADLVVIGDYGTPDKAKVASCEALYVCDHDGERVEAA